MRICHAGNASPRIEPQMTPMIDIVFQLLTFFLLSFKLAVPEGDFAMRMPPPATVDSYRGESFPLRVELRATASGELGEVRFGEHRFRELALLNRLLREIVGKDRGPGSLAESAEIELGCDPNLNYQHVIDAVTAISGYLDEQHRVITLIEKIRFGPPPQ